MSTRRMRFVVVWILVVGVLCPDLFAQSETAIKPKGSPIITLNWTQCYGTCPDYTVSIFEDGQFIYQGGVYVKVKGLASGAISKKQLKQLTDKFQKVGFFDMLGTVQRASLGCSPMATDLPTLTISFRQSNRLKTIRQYTGCLGLNKRFVAETKDLYDLDRLIKKVVEIERFIGTEDERQKLKFDDGLSFAPRRDRCYMPADTSSRVATEPPSKRVRQTRPFDNSSQISHARIAESQA